ncbi:MAG TPA: acetyl-CoA carboxylase biotin carboxyl carrier protein [Thermomicrobiales bacterium]|nr:acetyl-CoA carboxylase biotin carboxyl carrier protein [Thermomicrobiales bacterium]
MGKSDGQATPNAESVQLIFKEARDLAKALEGTATSRLRVALGGMKIEIERGGGAAAGGAIAPLTVSAAAAPATDGGAGAPAAAPGMLPVVAPLVGVFYRSGSPGAKPFVEVGDTVERGQVVGIVEAMKVMNEVTSDYRGTVAEILVENGDAVQYEQRLMLIDTGGAK